MIGLKNVTKKFGNKTAVDNISFEVNKGEIIALLGPNGAGKTTTMRMITGFLPPTRGSLTIAGVDISKDPMRARAKIGYMPENAPLYKEMTVYDYLKFIAQIKGVQKNEVETDIQRVIEATGLMDVKKTIIANLSKGFRQRTGLAQAIINNPEVLVLDEPTVGLDPRQIKDIRNLIKSMKGERTIILSTHILPEVAMTCDRVVVINDGKIAAIDDVKNLIDSNSRNSRIYIEIEAPAYEVINRLNRIKGVEEISAGQKTGGGVYSYMITTDGKNDVRRAIVAEIAGNKWGLMEFKRQQLSLEDVFLKLVTKEDA
jgi:ABC-2 type transport system ATP-binding protein